MSALSSRSALCALAASLALAGCGGGGDGGGTTLRPPAGWQRETANPLIIPFVADGLRHFTAADPSAMRDPDTGRWRIWYSTGVESVATGAGEVRIYTADSDDAIHWTLQVAPVLTAAADPAAWDHTHVETPCVLRNPDPAAPAAKRWLMFYSGGNLDAAAANNRPSTYPYYAIGLAYSADGRSFTRCTPGLHGQPGLVVEAASPGLFAPTAPLPTNDGAVADPEVVADGARLVMWFTSFAENAPTPPTPTGRTPTAFGISRAISDDGGVTWSFPQANPLTGLIPGSEQPSVVHVDGLWHLWYKRDTAAERLAIPTDFYTSVGVRHATSVDGIAWSEEPERDFTWDPTRAYEKYGIITGADVVRDGDQWRIFYAAWGDAAPNPDPTRFLVPLRDGTYVPATACLCSATKRAIPTGFAGRGVALGGLAMLPLR